MNETARKDPQNRNLLNLRRHKTARKDPCAGILKEHTYTNVRVLYAFLYIYIYLSPTARVVLTGSIFSRPDQAGKELSCQGSILH